MLRVLTQFNGIAHDITWCTARELSMYPLCRPITQHADGPFWAVRFQ